MRKQLLIVTVLAISLSALAVAPARRRGAATAATRSALPAPRPKLVVVITIDQFRYDYLERFRPYFVKDGFNRLLDGGAFFTDCRYNYATTVTGPGHATLFTGAYGNIHGIIENEWYDPVAHHKVYCVADPETHIVDSGDNGTNGANGPNGKNPADETHETEPGASPRNLMVSTIGDELRLATNFKSRVVAISAKDRSAVLPGGHTGEAYWWDTATGHFVTSTYYMPSLPKWAADFNARQPGKPYCGKNWQALVETPAAAGSPGPAGPSGPYGMTLGEFKPSPGEPCPDGKFAHWLYGTPFMTEIEINFAEDAIRSEHLGRGASTDLLSLAISANDPIGHEYGPYSPQVADVTLRTDRDLAGFFSDLDREVGLGNVWIVLDADHGVAPNPKTIKEHRLGPGNFRVRDFRASVEAALDKAFGPGPWIEALTEFYIYLNRSALESHGVDERKAAAVAAQAADAFPGVRAAFTRDQFLNGRLPDSPLARKAANSFNRERSGEVFVVLDPYAVPVAGENGTTHGTPWNYDAQIPLVFWGKAFRSGLYADSCQPIDMAATLAAALGLTQPSGTQGRPLTEALAAEAR